MQRTRMSYHRTALALGLILALGPLTPCRAEPQVQRLSGPLGLLGISGFSCRCSQVREDDAERWRWVFLSEPTIDGVDPDGPGSGKLREGDVIVAVDGMLITTHEGARRFSEIESGRTVELTLRRGALTVHERVVPDERGGSTELTINLESPGTAHLLERLSESLRRLERVMPEISALPEVPALPELPALPEMPSIKAIAELPDLEGLGNLVDIDIDTRPLGWFGIGISFSGSMYHRGAEDERPRWKFDDPPKVRSVDPDGPADHAGLRPGDVLTHIDGAPLDSAEGARRFSDVRPGQAVTWTVRRHGSTREITVVAEERPEL